MTDPRQNATINLVLKLVDLETEDLRSQRFSEQQIESSSSKSIPGFPSEACLRLHYYTPLASVLSKADMKCLTGYERKASINEDGILINNSSENVDIIFIRKGNN